MQSYYGLYIIKKNVKSFRMFWNAILQNWNILSSYLINRKFTQFYSRKVYVPLVNTLSIILYLLINMLHEVYVCSTQYN